MTSITDLPCAVCSKPIEAVDSEHPTQPYGANIFVSHGHYGATAYDSPGGENLEIFICTDCINGMRERNAINRVIHETSRTPRETVLWLSEDDSDEDNPKNKLRLENELKLEKFVESTEGMTEEWAHQLFEECHKTSQEGRVFVPGLIQ